MYSSAVSCFTGAAQQSDESRKISISQGNFNRRTTFRTITALDAGFSCIDEVPDGIAPIAGARDWHSATHFTPDMGKHRGDDTRNRKGTTAV